MEDLEVQAVAEVITADQEMVEVEDQEHLKETMAVLVFQIDLAAAVAEKAARAIQPFKHKVV